MPLDLETPLELKPKEFISLALLTIAIGREAGNQTPDAMLAVGWSIRNRVAANRLAQWGIGYAGVIEKRWQYSSINGPKDDPNLLKYPNLAMAPWPDALAAAIDVFTDKAADPTGGAHSYFDKSLDGNPPAWANDGEYVHACDIGSFHFYRLANA